MKMSRFGVCLFSVVIALCLQKGSGHSYSLGKCPHVDPMPGLSMSRMCGIWYVIQKTSTASTCITYNFTKLEEPDHFLLQQTSQHFLLGLTPLKHEYHYTGYLKVQDPSVPGRMTVKFPLNLLGSASYTIYMTDYDNYAAIFTCQSVGFGHRRSVSILSRSKSLDKVFIDKARTRLASYNIDPFDLSIISQKDCPKHPENQTHGINFNIDPHTFSAESVAGVIRTAGEKLGDGIEYVAGGAKKVYTTLSEAADKGHENGGKINSDAELINTASYISKSNPSPSYGGQSNDALSYAGQTNTGQVKNEDDESSTDTWLP